MNRDLKTPAALIALARSRRMQRAMAHAYLHRHDTIPSLRGTLHFVTDTTCVADDVAPPRGHEMTVLGVAPSERVAYVVEDLGDADEAPIIYRLWLEGPRAGHLVPIHAWYEQCDDPREIRARIAAIAPTLEPVTPATTEAWMLSTRVVQHRALRVAPPSRDSIRKFALQLKVEPVGGRGPAGHATVTAFLRPNATLAEVWMLASGDA
ncbi:MAG TPA: hypothetical protein VGH63_07450, partial [Polyangia bacterium]